MEFFFFFNKFPWRFGLIVLAVANVFLGFANIHFNSQLFLAVVGEFYSFTVAQTRGRI